MTTTDSHKSIELLLNSAFLNEVGTDWNLLWITKFSDPYEIVNEFGCEFGV